MRRRLYSVYLLMAAALLAINSPMLGAQTGIAAEGGSEFLLPIGARSVGMAQAVAAGGSGTDAIWWNPATGAHGAREVAFNLAQSNGILVTDASAAVVWPVPHLGAFVIAARYVNEGEQPAVDKNQQVIGSLVHIGTVLAGTFATSFGRRLSAGLTVKFFQFGLHCTGVCDLPASAPRTAAVDFGAQYVLRGDSLIVIGASGLNVGLPLQVNDSPQADPLPSRAIAGVSIFPRLSAASKDVRFRAEADLIKRLSGGGPGYRLGGEIAWKDQYAGRAGYQVNGPTGSGPTIGLGLATGKLRIDFAQFLTDAGTGAGKPTFLSLRYLF